MKQGVLCIHCKPNTNPLYGVNYQMVPEQMVEHSQQDDHNRQEPLLQRGQAVKADIHQDPEQGADEEQHQSGGESCNIHNVTPLPD